MAKVTYLFGAGASAKVLPIVNQIPDALLEFKKSFIDKRSGDDTRFEGHTKNRREMEEDFLIAIESLIQNLPKHESIDTYAKKLRITGKGEDYKRLKAIFSAFLIYKQLINDADRRYDSFFASILGTDATDFIGDINILTWNYDFQFEKAYSEFSNTTDLFSNQSMLDVNFKGLHTSSRNRQFSISKLNGTAGFMDPSWRNFYPISNTVKLTDERIFFQEFIKTYAYYTLKGHSVTSTLNFAWDYDSDEFYDKIAEKVKGTEVLVIIGYSIPFFNRVIDRKMIYSMAPTINQIYIQDINPDNVNDSFVSVWPENKKTPIVLMDYVERFFLPPQL